MAPVPFDVETSLARHGAALRALAIELVRCAADADDAVQETWLRALRRPPADGGTSGWFATILKNVVRRSQRDHVRRGRRECAVVRDERAEDHAVLAVREETTRRLLAAIETLDAATRDVVWRRFFEGQPPREIAAARGEPVATVKSRLQRGLEELRVRLGEDGRGEWRAAFTSAFGIGEPGVAASALAGGVLMATWAKLAGAAVVAALVFVVWWPGHDVPAPVGGSDPLAVAPAQARSSTLLADSAAAAPSTPSPASAGPTIEREAPHVAATTSVSGRCVDELGVPVAGCLVALSLSTPGSGSGSAALGLTAEPPVDPPAQRTGTDGSFRFDFSPSQTMDSSLSCATEGCVTAVLGMSLSPGQQLVHADIVLRRGVSVRGRVVDRKGLPVAGVQFDARSREPADASGHGRCRAAVTDRDGRFAFDGVLLPGVYAPGVGSGCTVREPDRIELSLARPVEDVVVVADVPIGIRGRVLDEGGAPVRATLYVEPAGPVGRSPSREANCLRDGTFFLPQAHGRGPSLGDAACDRGGARDESR